MIDCLSVALIYRLTACALLFFFAHRHCFSSYSSPQYPLALILRSSLSFLSFPFIPLPFSGHLACGSHPFLLSEILQRSQISPCALGLQLGYPPFLSEPPFLWIRFPDLPSPDQHCERKASVCRATCVVYIFYVICTRNNEGGIWTQPTLVDAGMDVLLRNFKTVV